MQLVPLAPGLALAFHARARRHRHDAHPVARAATGVACGGPRELAGQRERRDSAARHRRATDASGTAERARRIDPAAQQRGAAIITEDSIDLAERFIQAREGCRLVAYRDAVGRWTIGFGATGAGIDATTRWTQAQADADLRRRLREEFAPAVASAVRVPLTVNQAAALMSLAYNIGVSAFEHATLVAVLNTADYAGAAKHFADFTKAHIGSQLTTLDGLAVRRAAEAKLFLQDVA